DALVLHGHLPAGELDHLRARVDVTIEQGGAAQRRRHGQQASDAARRAAGASAQKRRYVDVVVGDLERGALAIVDARTAVATRAALGAGAAPGTVVEAGADHGHADLVGHALVDHGAEDDVGVGVGG